MTDSTFGLVRPYLRDRDRPLALAIAYRQAQTAPSAIKSYRRCWAWVRKSWLDARTKFLN